MKKEIEEKLRSEYEMCPEAFGGPVLEGEIDKAEKILNVKLPHDYRMFIQRYGSGGVGQVVILGLREAEFVATPSFVEQSLRVRKELPKEYAKLVVISIDGAGNPIGFVPPDEKIFVYDHNFGGRHDLAKNFEEYLEKAINGVLEV